MLPLNSKQHITQLYECIKSFHNLEVLPVDLPNPQTEGLLPTLRPYQVKTVKWMLWKEMFPSYYQSDLGNGSSDAQVLLPKGGVLAEEMGLGKTVEVLACMLANPREKVKNTSHLDEKNSLYSKKIKIEIKSEFDAEIEHNTEADVLVGNFETVDIKNGFGVDCSRLEELRTEEEDPETYVSKVCVVEPPPKINRNKRVLLEDMPLSVRWGKFVEAKKGKSASSKQSNAKKQKTTEVSVTGLVGGKRKRACQKPGETFKLLKSWYDDCLSEMSYHTEQTRSFQCSEDFRCCCVEEFISDDLVECPRCRTWQHAECVNYNKTAADYEYYCFRCWVKMPQLVSSGTVIISPEAIFQQWVSEIKKHVDKENLKVLVYEGVRVNGYIQPNDLASFDIIITTYQVLNKELNYTEPVSRSLRHMKRYYAPTSPLLFVQWWRLCLDEAQMVEGSTCRAAEMANKFSAVNKWAVTGTPVQKAVNDILGLMEFLAGNDYPEFLQMIKDSRVMLLMVPRVLWRTQMKDVLAETGVPPQTVDTHLLHFSKIEKYFYQCTHTECAHDFISKIRRFGDLNVLLKSLDRKVIANLLSPLLKLRQACLHPQAVRGKFVSVKKTMNMIDLLQQMVTDAKLDAEQSLRQLVSGLNGSAALHIIREEWREAVEAYRAVLHLEQEHKGRLKIDSLQRIHSMHNLADVLDGGYNGIPPTLRDSTLRDDVKALELRYLGKRETPITTIEMRLTHQDKKIGKELAGKALNSYDWWLELLKWTQDRDELLLRLRAAVQHTDDKQKNQYNALASKLKSLYIVQMEVGIWLNKVDETRGEVIGWVRTLKNSDRDLMATEALRCHLPQAASFKRLTRCSLCQAEDVLMKYEALLFEELSKKKRKGRFVPGAGPNQWEEELDMDEIAEVAEVNINTFESSKKGGFKASPIEKLLRALASYGRQKQAPTKWTSEASYQIRLLDRIKKEFLDLNLMWRQIFDLVDAKDELNMCKTRLRLPYAEEEAAEKESRKKKKQQQLGDLHIIAQYKVEPELEKLTNEKKVNEAELKKKIGILCYLENLRKEGPPSTPICPVCRNDLTDKWSVLQCGHCVCLECLGELVKPMNVSLVCPQCRHRCSITAVSCIEKQDTPLPASITQVQGNYSTKVDAVIMETLNLTQQKPDVKIIVFSAWEKVLNLLAEAFEKNNITFRRLKSGKLKSRQTLKEFKTTDVTVLLLLLRSGAKGLNLVEATHVFLVEPILNPAEELQAVGRVHRIGQDKPTVVHRFIVRETIEERILATVAESGGEQLSDDCVTLQQMCDLFSGQEELPMELSIMRQSSASTSGRSQATVNNLEDSDSDQEHGSNHHGRRVTFGENVSIQEETFSDDNSDSDLEYDSTHHGRRVTFGENVSNQDNSFIPEDTFCDDNSDSDLEHDTTHHGSLVTFGENVPNQDNSFIQEETVSDNRDSNQDYN